MKKTAVVLCILLSLFIVSCAEPENAPKDNKLVIKVRNSDLPVGAEKIVVDAYGDKGPLFNPSICIDVASGDYTELPLSDELIQQFVTSGKVEFLVLGLSSDEKPSKEDNISCFLSYEKGKTEYIIEKPEPRNITLKVEESPYYQKVTGYRWKSDFSSQTYEVSRSDGTETVLGTLSVPPMYGGVSIYLSVIGEGDSVIGDEWIYIELVDGQSEYVLKKPAEKLVRNIEVAPQNYMLPVFDYSFTFRGEYRTVDAASDGNTVLFTASDLRDGEEYELHVYNRRTRNGDITYIGDAKGVLHVNGDSRNIVIDPPVPRGCMELDCNPTFRTDHVSWHYEKKNASGEWETIPGTYGWNPEWPQRNRYYLEPGEYKIVNLWSDEYANGSDQGAWDKMLPEQEFKIESGKGVKVNAPFADYPGMRVRFRIKTTYEYVGSVKMGITIGFNDKTYCERQLYSQLTEHFDYDSDTKEVTYTWWGIPVDTDTFNVTLYLGGSLDRSKEFKLNDIVNGEIYWDSTK